MRFSPRVADAVQLTSDAVAHTLQLNALTVDATGMKAPSGEEVPPMAFFSIGDAADARPQVKYIEFDKKYLIKYKLNISTLLVTQFYLYGPTLPSGGVGPFKPVDNANWTEGVATFTGEQILILFTRDFANCSRRLHDERPGGWDGVGEEVGPLELG